jgi:hypothetical protein
MHFADNRLIPSFASPEIHRRAQKTSAFPPKNRLQPARRLAPVHQIQRPRGFHTHALRTSALVEHLPFCVMKFAMQISLRFLGQTLPVVG